MNRAVNTNEDTCTVMRFMKRRDLLDLIVVSHHADLDPKSIVKSSFWCSCQDNHMLFIFFLKIKSFFKLCCRIFFLLFLMIPAEIRGKKFNEHAYKYDSMFIEQIIKVKKHPMRTL